MSRMFEDLEAQIALMSKGMSFLDKNALLMHEIDLQLNIYKVFTTLGVLMIVLGVVL
jgi:hypothetical protein